MAAPSQISLFEYLCPDQEEIQFINGVFPKLKQVLSDYGATPDNLIYDQIGDKTVVKYKPKYSEERIIFYIRIRKKSHYIELHNSMLDIVPEEMPVKKSESPERKYFRINIAADDLAKNYSDLLIAVTKATLDRWPKGWDCCSRFEKCSDAKVCIHPDKEFALGCGYRKILNSGRVFYGKNKNI